jgi:hypothetical protein
VTDAPLRPDGSAPNLVVINFTDLLGGMVGFCDVGLTAVRLAVCARFVDVSPPRGLPEPCLAVDDERRKCRIRWCVLQQVVDGFTSKPNATKKRA